MITRPIDDFNITPVLKTPVGEIRLPGLIRLHRFKAGDGSRGFLEGVGVTTPAPQRMRLMVMRVGMGSSNWPRCQAMEAAPASRP